MNQHQDLVDRPVLGTPGELLMLDLHVTPDRLATALAEALTQRHWLDSYLLSAGLLQLVEDHLHPDPWQLRRGARYLRGGQSPLARSAGTVMDAAAASVGVLLKPRRVQRRLLEARHSMARLTAVLAALVQDPLAEPPDRQQVRRMAAEATACVPLVDGDVARLPACFRSFDLHPDDVGWLTRALVERYGPPSAPLCVVGVRTSGCYLAPLFGAALQAAGASEVHVLTYRPGRPFQRWEKDILAAVAHADGRVVVTDDPPGSGTSLRTTVSAVTQAGVPRERVTLALSMFTGDPQLPRSLRGFRAVLQPWPDMTVHRRLDSTRVAHTLGDMIGPQWRVDRCLRRDEVKSHGSRRHASGRYAVQATNQLTGEQQSLDVLVEGVGLGYLGRHAVAVGSALDRATPRVYGFADGLLYREWLHPAPQPMDEVTGADVIAGYAAHRRRLLATSTDPTPRMGGRDPVWEVAAGLLGRVYGPLAPVARPYLLEPLTRRLLRPLTTSVVDGATELNRWMPDPARPGHWAKVDFHERAFSHLEVACYDAAFDLAGAVGDPPSGEFGHRLRRAFHRETGEVVDRERWLLYRLTQHSRSAKAGEIDEVSMARRSADAVHAYLADCFLSECFLSDRVLGDGPLCAIDLDGVLETDRLGYPASGPEGAMALRGLVAHGYRPVLATGRSMVDARDRCTVFGLAGAVAEYGTVVYEHRQRATTDLRTPSEQDLVERVRETLDAKGLEVDPGHRYAVRVRLDDGPVSPELLGTIPLLSDPRLQVIHGQGQSDVALRRLDKAAGVRALAERLGASRLALAVGDSAADLPMLQMAELPRAPRNAQARLAAAGIPVTRGAYQAGLLEACGALIGHRPGGCPVCRIPPFPLRTRALLAVLALPGNGIEALPVRTARLTLAVARMLRDSTDG